MRINKEGYKIICISGAVCVFIFWLIYHLLVSDSNISLLWVSAVLLLLFWFFIVAFFREPRRVRIHDADLVFSPCDGRVVVTEVVKETEYLKEEMLQISIFMSVTNVHMNWVPVGGTVEYFKYHPGRFLVAWHPKSSTENERTTTVVRMASGRKVLFRQIAGLIDAGTNGVLALVDQNALQTKPLGNLVGKGRTDDAVAVRMGEVILQLRFTLIVNGVDGNFREALKYIEIHLPAFAVNRHGDFFRPQLLGPLKAVQIVGHIDVQLDKMLIKPPLELLGIGGAGHKDLTAFADGLVDRLYQCFNGALF